jgi:myo-inositol-1(or 4)-monophosphatase
VNGGVNERFDVAEAAIREAGRLAAGYAVRLAELEVRSKGVQDVVTEADLQVELLLRRRLLDAFPDDAFYGEETGLDELEGRDGIWVVDPIDGTQPFVSGMASWCISVGFVRGGEPDFGLVLAPAPGELFAGGRHRPATLNGRLISTHPGTTLTDGIVAIGYSPRIGADDILPVFDRLLRSGGTYYRNGSGALMLCDVAAGRLLGYVEPHINAYDCLAGIAIVQAAGGRTNDYLGGPDAMLQGNRIVAGPPQIYDELERVLGEFASRRRRPPVG